MIVGSDFGGDIMRDKGGGPFRAPPNKHLKPSNAFKDYGWFLTCDDKHVVLKISTYPWMENKVWCSKAWSKREIVQKIVTPAYTHDLDSCEIFVVSKASNAIYSYVLKCANIIGDVVDVDGMKVVGIPKARKWWKKLSDSEKLIRTSMLEVYRGLSPLEEEKLIEYMDSYQRFQTRVVDSLSSEPHMQEPEEPSKDVRWRGTLSFPYERAMDVDSQLELIVCSQTPSHLREEDTRFELTAKNLVTPTQGSNAQHSKDKGRKLVSSHTQCSLEDSFNPPSQAEIDEGYVYGRDFSFIVDMNHVRPPTDGFTNQHVLNIENAKKVYKALRDKHIVDSSWIILRSMFYKDPNGGTSEATWFKGVGLKDRFSNV